MPAPSKVRYDAVAVGLRWLIAGLILTDGTLAWRRGFPVGLTGRRAP